MENRPLPGPTVDPLGIVRYPTGYAGAPRAYGPGLRLGAAALLVVFALVVVVSTGVSLGRYCLTSDGANVSRLAPWIDGRGEVPATPQHPPSGS